MKKTAIYLFILFSVSSIAQNVGIDITNPDADAALDIYSLKKGVLLTRLELISTDNPSPLTNHVEGMTTYNTTNTVAITPTSVSEGIYYNDGTKWNLMGPNTLMIGDIKHSLEGSDHKGWFLLNGRNVSTLNPIAQYNANAVGIGVNLPNMNDKFIKTTNGLETVTSTAGANSIVLTQANLPNISYTATTTSNGNHSHQYTDAYNGVKTLGLATNVLPLVPLISETVGTNDTVPANLHASANSGSHSHTVSVPSGGSDTPINGTPKHIVTNVFIYLGE
ncbi:hypothetical protein ABGT15_07985 [Flavobacterium enshiense]|uniref:hypothetical protein n=1 Tax=Flavobacterium enshiense TaxID=1341165 RepID=UPI00345CB511